MPGTQRPLPALVSSPSKLLIFLPQYCGWAWVPGWAHWAIDHEAGSVVAASIEGSKIFYKSTIYFKRFYLCVCTIYAEACRSQRRVSGPWNWNYKQARAASYVSSERATNALTAELSLATLTSQRCRHRETP